VSPQIVGGSKELIDGVAELTNSSIARTAQQTAQLPCRVVVVDVQRTYLAADCASPVLLR